MEYDKSPESMRVFRALLSPLMEALYESNAKHLDGLNISNTLTEQGIVNDYDGNDRNDQTRYVGKFT